MNEFQSGPFIFTPGESVRLAGNPARKWTVNYGAHALAWHTISDAATQDEIRERFADDIGGFVGKARRKHAPEIVYLIDFETGETVAKLPTLGVPDMTAGMIDDRSRYWLRSSDKLRSRNVTLSEFAALAARYRAPDNAWIAGLLPDYVLTADAESWRAPTNWEIRHIVGEGSFIGISGTKAASLVGVTPQNFRKYTASDTARGRQSISFAMWHLLLARLNVQRLT